MGVKRTRKKTLMTKETSKEMIKYGLLLYWIIGNINIILSFCGIEQDIKGNMLGIIIYILLLVVPGAVFVAKSINKQWYRKWWAYLIYFFIITYPLLAMEALKHTLCGSTTF